MEDFHLGDRITWVPENLAGIIIDLLDYEGGGAGMIGVLMDNRQFRSLRACECRVQVSIDWDSLHDYGDYDSEHYGFPGSDVY